MIVVDEGRETRAHLERWVACTLGIARGAGCATPGIWCCLCSADVEVNGIHLSVHLSKEPFISAVIETDSMLICDPKLPCTILRGANVVWIEVLG